MSEHYPNVPVFPGINTIFIGSVLEHRVWSEHCQSCGSCLVHNFGGLWPHRPLLQKPDERPLRRLGQQEWRE